MKRTITLVLLIGSLFMVGCHGKMGEATPNGEEGLLPVETNTDPVAEVNLEDLSQYFTGYEGTFVLLDPQLGEYTIYNEPKSETRVSPYSTYKILNSLIGLEVGVLEDENSSYPWDHQKHSIEAWNQDHTLASAIKHSVVWYYQQLARDIGPENMQTYLDLVNYGNKDISGGIDTFWLGSSLKVSPKEQVEMLRQFYYYQLPFSKEHIDIVKSIIVNEEKNGITFSGKTGGPTGRGWFIGYVEREDKVYIFATYIEGGEANGPKAREISRSILEDKGIL